MFNTSPPYNITTVNDVTATRAIGVEYTNNTGRTLFILITLSCTAPLVGDRAIGLLKTPSAFTTVSAGFMAGVQPQTLFNLAGVVRPGETYKLDEVILGTGAFGFSMWKEFY